MHLIKHARPVLFIFSVPHLQIVQKRPLLKARRIRIPRRLPIRQPQLMPSLLVAVIFIPKAHTRCTLMQNPNFYQIVRHGDPSSLGQIVICYGRYRISEQKQF